MNRNVRFDRWRIGLKTIKWWGVLCVVAYPLATILQAHVLHFQYPNDAYAYALLIVTFLGPVIAGIFYILEEAVDNIDGQALRKKENFICLGLSAVFLLLTFAVF